MNIKHWFDWPGVDFYEDDGEGYWTATLKGGLLHLTVRKSTDRLKRISYGLDLWLGPLGLHIDPYRHTRLPSLPPNMNVNGITIVWDYYNGE